MTSSRKVFGKGLDDIFNIINENSRSLSENIGELRNIVVQHIYPGAYQPRKKFDDDSLLGLASSIKEKGIIQPIVVRQIDDGVNQYEIIAGERRWRAAQMAGLQQVPVVVVKIDHETALAFSLIENIQREDLNAIEEAEAFKRLLEEFKLTHDEVAQKVGKSRSAITNSLRLLKLCQEVRVFLENGDLSAGHAKVILGLEDSKQIKIAKLIVNKQLSVRATEKLVQQTNNPKSSVNKSNIFNEKIKLWEKQLYNLIHDTVRIKMNDKGEGSVTIRFKSEEEIEWLVNQLKSK